jgi:hypothetical protein
MKDEQKRLVAKIEYDLEDGVKRAWDGLIKLTFSPNLSGEEFVEMIERLEKLAPGIGQRRSS